MAPFMKYCTRSVFRATTSPVGLPNPTGLAFHAAQIAPVTVYTWSESSAQMAPPSNCCHFPAPQATMFPLGRPRRLDILGFFQVVHATPVTVYACPSRTQIPPPSNRCHVYVLSPLAADAG